MQKHETVTILHGDCRNVLATIPSGSVDAVVTDPPYGLEFMGKDWDAPWRAEGLPLPTQGFQRWFETVAAELLRVLKPGGHLLAFGGTRTYHRLACAIEDAGFEVRDSIHWLYGSGFPKSLDVSKAIDKAAGAAREVVGTRTLSGTAASTHPAIGTLDGTSGVGATKAIEITAPATAEAQAWSGWGTALKPAHEPIVVARKPLAGTVAANVLAHGTGALNIDGCRVGSEGGTMRGPGGGRFSPQGAFTTGHEVEPINAGRWPANIVHDGSPEVLERFPDAMGDDGSAARFFTSAEWHDDDAASFYYCAKAGTRERNQGLDGLPRAVSQKWNEGGIKARREKTALPIANIHPTVKPVALMRWLVRLVTPPDGIVLDPFTGSGTTLVAAVLEGKRAVGVEMTDEYLPIIRGRVAWAQAQADGELFHAGE